MGPYPTGFPPSTRKFSLLEGSQIPFSLIKATDPFLRKVHIYSNLHTIGRVTDALKTIPGRASCVREKIAES